jgi:D-alanyl-D-alanine dipeptidase
MLNCKNLNTLFWTVTIFCVVLLNGCVTRPPNEKGDFNKSDLVELIRLDSTFKLDIKYATSNNFVGRPLIRQTYYRKS